MKLLKLPGLIDVHVHLREPGGEQKEDFSTGTKAAIAGGVTMVVDMPNNVQPITTPERLARKITLAKDRIYCDLGFHFAANKEAVPNFQSVAPKVIGYKLYMNHTTGNLIVSSDEAELVFKNIPKDRIVIVHAEGPTLDIAIEMAKKYQKRIHVAHVSLASEVKAITEAKKSGLQITAEVTPHHLFLTNEDVKTLGSLGMMKPPLQSQKDVEALWTGIKEGTIDMVATDHAPHTLEEKRSDKPPFGVPGVETTLPLLLTAVNEGRLTIEQLLKVTHDNPKKIFSLPDQENTYIEVDIDQEYVLENENMFSKSGWTPFVGKKIKAKIVGVYLRGEKVFDGKKIIGEPRGRIITTTN